MFGLVVLFSLGLWIVLTILAVKFGRKIFIQMLPQYAWAGKAGAFAGFMLLMGSWIVPWTIEYIQGMRFATEMCKQAGVHVYVTPQEWKQMLGGDEEWRKFKLHRQRTRDPVTYKVLPGYQEYLNFRGNRYHLDDAWSHRVLVYSRTKWYNYVFLNETIFYDSQSGKVLWGYMSVKGKAPNIANNLNGLKFWLDTYPECEVNSQEMDYLYNHFFYPNNLTN